MGAAGMGAASALSLGGGIWGALSADAAGTYNQKMAEADAKALDDMAVDAIARGEEDAQQVGLEGRRVLGAQRTAIAGQGIDVSTGTAAELQAETLRLTGEDEQRVRVNAAREALGIRTQAARTRSQGRMAKRSAEGQAVGSVLTGGAGAISMAAQGYEMGTR